MASISLPPQSRSAFSQHFDSPPSNTESSRRLTMPPLPNPPFVFPAHDPDASVSSQDSEHRTPPALPAFSFNPGSESTLQPAHVPYRPNGHRRRHSEFVGDNQLVTPGLGDTDKREEPSTQTQPSLPAPGPPRGPGRRNHAHRRSQAVSGVDLMAIQKALATPGGSAPNTPGDPLDKGHEDNSRPLSYSAGSLGRPTPPASPQFPPSDIPPVPPIPAAIRIESAPSNEDLNIGRPVSAVCHETPESPATIKPTPPEIPTTPAEKMRTPNRNSKPRPKTADASLAFDFMQAQNVPGVPALKRSKSTGHSRKDKSRSAHLNATLPNHASDDAHSTDTSRPSYSDDGSEASSDNENHDDSSPRKSKSKKKQKGVRSWAGAILGKGKRHAKNETEIEASPEKEKVKGKQKKPPALTPPTLTRTNSAAGSVMEVDFDNDDVLIIRTPTNPEGPVPQTERSLDERPAPSLESSWKPRSFYEQTAQDEILSSPIIDLDAALGPFNTPDMRQTQRNLSQFSVATQRMYSGGRRGEFVGPEMRYHRRTESAPVMQPFDRSALGPIRLGGKGAETPDVFYEEEEDAFLAESQSPRNGRERPAPVPVTESPESSDDDKKPAESVKSTDSADTLTRAPVSSPPQPEPQPEPQTEGLGIQATEEPVSPKKGLPPVQQDTPESLENAGNPFAGEARSPVECLKSEEIDPKQMAPPSPDVSPGYLAVDKRPATSPNQLPLNIPPFCLSGGVSPSDSSFPSPDVLRFPDRNFSSHSYNHLPSEYPYPYGSAEDVPSLTSSASTTTNTRTRFSATFFPRGRLSTDRAASFSAAGHRRSSHANSSKRSSLASLSKLVGAPQSERSKLYHEEKPPSDAADKSKKKNHRISRLMHFWKVKDKEKSASEPTIPEGPV
ncbi:hypothetical protein N7486_001502 [Penicillium sp. IBT 16267x]|nr:hypothetical protein N7486_001502 [Penicillium sp. IBT 16267x]